MESTWNKFEPYSTVPTVLLQPNPIIDRCDPNPSAIPQMAPALHTSNFQHATQPHRRRHVAYHQH